MNKHQQARSYIPYVEIAGTCVHVRIPTHQWTIPPTRTGEQIQTFSQQSRRNLLTHLNRIDWDATGDSRFVTLTFPDRYAFLPYEDRSKIRYLFMRYVEKYLGRQIATVWRTEWEERKSGALIGHVMPHFHMILFNSGFLPWRRLRSWFAKILGHEGPIHTYVQRVDSPANALRYIAKYISASTSFTIAAYHNNLALLGRSWGFTRKYLIPWAKPIVWDVQNLKVVEMLCRYGRHVLGDQVVDYGRGFTLFGAKARDAITRIIEKYSGQKGVRKVT